MVTASVIIPTVNRQALLADLLRRLDAQDADPDAVEIVVVDVGSTDGTREMLAHWTGSRPMRHLQLDQAGAAKARNAGAREATGNLFIFLDDDMAPPPTLITAYLEAARNHPGTVFLGPCPMTDVRGPFRRMLARWYRVEYKFMTAAERPEPARLLSGNLAVPRAVFNRVGGFDESYIRYGGEDADFGFRLFEAEIPVRYEPSASCDHRFASSLRTWLHRIRLAGASTVMLIQKHPEAARAFPAGRLTPRMRLRRPGARLAWYHPRLGELVIPVVSTLCDVMEVMGLERPWEKCYQILYDHQYWAGVRDAVGDRRIWQRSRPWGPEGESRSKGIPRVVRLLLTRITIWWLRLLDDHDVLPLWGAWGHERGTPIDRYYIKNFIAAHASEVRGRVLEFGWADYKPHFDPSRIERYDIIDLEEHDGVTLVGDIQHVPQIPDATFDCIVCTQVLLMVRDPFAAVREMHRVLKPGGLLLLTVPQVALTMPRNEFPYDYWRFTEDSVRLLLTPFSDVRITVHGNPYAAFYFANRIVVEDLTPADLDWTDLRFPLHLNAYARK